MENNCCSTCGQSEEWHEENQPRHPFDGPLVNESKREKPKVRVNQSGGDPVLRLALIEAGILTYEQLAIAEEKLNNARNTGRPIISEANSDQGSPVT